MMATRLRRLLLIVGSFAPGLVLTGAVDECSFDSGPDPSISSELRAAHRTFAPQWAEGGKSIVFGHQGSLYVISVDGSRLRRLSKVSRNDDPYEELNRDYSPSVSPDGTRIAYTTLRYDTGSSFNPVHSFEIVTFAIDGSDVKRLTDNEYMDTNPVWSPDGTRIAFLSDREDLAKGRGVSGTSGRLTPFTMAVDGSDVQSLAPSVPVAGGAPAWSPDGTKLAFYGYELPGWIEEKKLFVKGYVYVVGADGSNLTKLIERRSPAGAGSWISNREKYVPIWAPDSSSVVFRWWDEVGRTIRYVADSDGANLRKVPEDGTVNRSWKLPNLGKIIERLPYPLALAWSADDSSVAARSYEEGIRGVHETRTELYIVASDGSEARRLVSTGDEGELIHGSRARIVVAPPPAPCSEGVVVPHPEQNAGLVQDCETLLSVRGRLNVGGALPRWEPDIPISDWEGVEVGDSPPRVVSLRLSPIVNGTVSPKLSNLVGLKTLSLKEGSVVGALTGPIPSELGNLRNLERLELVGHLTGGIPSSLGNLTKLNVLDLHTNANPAINPNSQLTGEIPSALGSLINLTYLSLSGHRLTGGIPPELGNLTKLTYLALNDNRLTGRIPSELGRLMSLESLYLQSNNLSGTIPPELEGLPNLTVLILDRNDLSGCVPAGLAKKTRSGLAPC